jgi:alkylhydroperoxidase/carboxymuconolactone decarboxylase family protein YurZ
MNDDNFGSENTDTMDTEEADTSEAEVEWTPPTREEFEELLAKKQRADSEAASRKRWLRDNGIDPKTGKKTAVVSDEDSEDGEPAHAVERAKAKAEQAARNNAKALISEVPSALFAADLNPQHLNRALKLLDLDSLHVDEDGVDGLREQIAELKEDFPEFFKRTRMRDVAPASAVGGGNKKPETKAKDGWDIIRERFNNGTL